MVTTRYSDQQGSKSRQKVMRLYKRWHRPITKRYINRDQLFPQKPLGSRFRFSRTGVQPSPGSSTIELPSAFAESGAYPPDRELRGASRQCSLPLACRHPPEGHQIGARKRRTPENTIISQPYCRRVSTDRPNREGSQLAESLEGEPGPRPAGKTLPPSYPETRFRRERARDPRLLPSGNPFKYHVETLSLQPMKQYIITTMLDVVLRCFCFVFAFSLVSLHGD